MIAARGYTARIIGFDSACMIARTPIDYQMVQEGFGPPSARKCGNGGLVPAVKL